MTTWTDIDQMCLEMVHDGQDPGGIVGSPVQIKRLLGKRPEQHVGLLSFDGQSPCGWSYAGLPIARSYEVSGPCVVSREVYKALQKCGRVRYLDNHSALATTIAVATEDPVLF